VIVEDARAAGLNNDGSLSLHEQGTVDATLVTNMQRVVLFTVDGDFLVTSETGFDANNPSTDDVDLWVRFTCVR